MGKNNQARRAAKAKQRRQRSRPPGQPVQPGPAGPTGASAFGFDLGASAPVDPVVRAHEGWARLLEGARRSSPRLGVVADDLARLPRHAADDVGCTLLTGVLPHLWRGGWQPAEVVRHVRREATAAAASLTELAIRAEHARHVGVAVDERWARQVAELDHADVSLRSSWLATWRERRGIPAATGYLAAVAAMTALESVPRLDLLVPPPGHTAPLAVVGVRAGAGGDDPVLRRVRKLLAKAESTEFAGEAESLTAKAQELMTRHAIDAALVEAPDADDVPRMMRLPVDAPYADAKSLLVAVVAGANRCRAVYLGYAGMSTVVGHDRDLALVEMLFTSLLVQAQQALTQEGRAAGAGSRARSSAFRSSFFQGFAGRIGERLEQANAAAFTEAESAGRSALPVLRSREQAVEDAFDERFGANLTTSAVRGGHDRAGQALGRRAADRARLDAGALPG